MLFQNPGKPSTQASASSTCGQTSANRISTWLATDSSEVRYRAIWSTTESQSEQVHLPLVVETARAAKSAATNFIFRLIRGQLNYSWAIYVLYALSLSILLLSWHKDIELFALALEDVNTVYWTQYYLSRNDEKIHTHMLYFTSWNVSWFKKLGQNTCQNVNSVFQSLHSGWSLLHTPAYTFYFVTYECSIIERYDLMHLYTSWQKKSSNSIFPLN